MQPTEERRQLKAAKEALRPADQPAPEFTVEGNPGDPVSYGVTKVTFTAKQRADSITSEIEADQAALAALEQSSPDDIAQANRYRRRIAENQASLRDVHDIQLEFPYTHLGAHSIYWTANTLDSNMAIMKDPSNVLFYDVGSAFDAEYDLRN